MNARDVRYMVVGGHAVSFHAYPRFTHDVDVVVLPDEENARAVVAALSDFGFAATGLSVADFIKPTTVVLRRPPDQIAIMTFLKGMELDEAWTRRVAGVVDDVDVSFASKTDPHRRSGDVVANALKQSRHRLHITRRAIDHEHDRHCSLLWLMRSSLECPLVTSTTAATPRFFATTGTPAHSLPWFAVVNTRGADGLDISRLP